MERPGIIDFTADAPAAEVLQKGIPPGSSDDKLVEDMAAVGSHRGRFQVIRGQSQPIKLFGVPGGVLLAALSPLLEIGELDQKDSGLEGIQTEIAAHQPMIIFRLGPMISEASKAIRKIGVIGNHQAAVAHAT